MTAPEMFVAVIVVPLSVSSRNDGQRRPGVAVPIGIVTRVRCDERSSALLQFARFRRSATESRSWAGLVPRPRRKGSEVVRN